MPYPTKRQRKALARDLKSFAFEQSPMFQHGQIQSAETYQVFEFIEKVPEDVWMPGTLQYDQTKIKLGFRATRFASDDGQPPVYSYEVTTEGTSLIHPRQLNLSDEAWRVLWKKYFDDEMDEEELPDGAVLDAEESAISDDSKADLIDTFVDGGIECELYQKNTLSFASCEEMIESSYERGVSIEAALFDTLSTHDYYHDDGWEAHQTPDGELYIPPRYAPDELPIADEIEVRTRFSELISAYGTDREAAENGLLPHEHKLREMMYVVECLRKRRIDLV